MNNYNFPFSAIIGQDTAKEALIYGIINPRIGGVLLCGQKGCAKSTMVRSLGSLLKDMDIVDLPLNVTEDMLVGTINIQSAIEKGEKEFAAGILKRAHGNILYADEVNLLSGPIAKILLDVSQSNTIIVEREGISHTHKSNFLLVGTMNPEESTLSSQLLDRFGIYVEVKGEADKKKRMEIMKKRIAFEDNPIGFFEVHKQKNNEITKKLNAARIRVKDIALSETIVELSAQLAIDSNAQGHRAEIIIIETAIAIAAYNDRLQVIDEDVYKAAGLVLPHRIRDCVMPQEELEQTAENLEEEFHDEQTDAANDEQKNLDCSVDEEDNTQHQQTNANTKDPTDSEDKIDEGNEIYTINDISLNQKEKRRRKGSGRRSKTVSDAIKGRYIGFSMPRKKSVDIAFDATLRAASVHQKSREKNGNLVSIHSEDIRIKRREHRIGTTIIFAVDASGSMGARKRMIETKEAILSLLFDAYQKRDKVGMIAFRKDKAEILLPITRSIELAQKRLQSLPTGGRTPLAKGLMLSWQMIFAQKIKDKNMIPLLILVTDGKANDKNSGNPYIDAINISKAISKANISSIVIDTEKPIIPIGIAKEIADNMNAEYYKVNELKSGTLSHIIKTYRDV